MTDPLSWYSDRGLLEKILTEQRAAFTHIDERFNTMSDDIEQVRQDVEAARAEVAAENEEDVLSEQERAALRARVDELEAQIPNLEQAVSDAVAGKAGAEEKAQVAIDGLRETIAGLRADNPVPEG